MLRLNRSKAKFQLPINYGTANGEVNLRGFITAKPFPGKNSLRVTILGANTVRHGNQRARYDWHVMYQGKVSSNAMRILFQTRSTYALATIILHDKEAVISVHRALYTGHMIPRQCFQVLGNCEVLSMYYTGSATPLDYYTKFVPEPMLQGRF